MNLYLSTIIWGEEFIESFVNYTIPSLLSSGNLKSEKVSDNSIFTICCYRDEREILTKRKNFQLLEKNININFLYIDKKISKDKYQLVSKIQEVLLKDATEKNNNYYFMFVYPDSIYSNNSINYINEIVDKNYDNILIPGPLVSKEFINERFEFENINLNDGINCSDLADCVFKGMNPFYQVMDYKYINTTKKVKSVFFNKSTNAYLFSCFNLHPLVIKIYDNHRNTKINQSLDGVDLRKILISNTKTHFVKSSEEVIVLTFESFNSQRSTLSNKMLTILSETDIPHSADSSIDIITNYAEEYTNIFQRECFLNTFILYNSKFNTEENQEELDFFNQYVDSIKIQVLTNLLVPDSVLKQNNSVTYSKRKSNKVNNNPNRSIKSLKIVNSRIRKSGIFNLGKNIITIENPIIRRKTDAYILLKIKTFKFSKKLVLFLLAVTPYFIYLIMRHFYVNLINRPNFIHSMGVSEIDFLLRIYGRKRIIKSFLSSILK